MTPEGAILKSVLDYLAAEHVLAFRMNTLAMPTPDGKRFIKAGTPGMADVLAFPWTKQVLRATTGNYSVQATAILPVWLEVKASKGRQSDLQKSFQDWVETEGHRYAIVRSIEDVKEALNAR